MNTPSKIKAVIYLAAIFAVGLVAGGVAGYSFGKEAMAAPPRPKKMAESTIEKLKSELHLTPEQVAQIKPIVRETAQEIETVHSSICDQIWTIIDLSNSRIEKYLTPEQAAKLRDNEKSRRDHFKKVRWENKKQGKLLPETIRLCQKCGNEEKESETCSNEKVLPSVLTQ